ncbi:MAG: mechanosensitive ion channel [Pseudomonadota bacterium]|nr:mechanosensitive ion channel [Pseudomonadota bacterium]
MTFLRPLILVLCMAWLAAGLSSPVLAQGKADSRSGKGSPTTAELEDLLSTLDDPVAAGAMKSRLRTMIAARRTDQEQQPSFSERILQRLSGKAAEISAQAVSVGAAFLDAPQAMRWLRKQVSDDITRDRWLRLLTELVLILTTGFLVKWGVSLALKEFHRLLADRVAPTRMAFAPVLLLRTLLDIVPAIAFALTGLGIMSVTLPPAEIRLVAMTVITATVIVHVLLALTRFLFSPSSESLRLVPVSDETANYILIWTRRILVVVVCGYFISESARVLGLPQASYLALLKIVGAIVTVMAIILILQNRQEVARRLRGIPRPAAATADADADPGPAPELAGPARFIYILSLRRKLAAVWHILAILYVIVIYGVLALEVEGGFFWIVQATVETVVILVLTRLAIQVLRLLIRRGFSVSPELKAQYPHLESRANLYLPIVEKIFRNILWFFAILVMAHAWGVDSLSWMGTAPGQRAISGAVSILLVTAVSIVVWEAVSQWIERYLAGAAPDGNRVERSARTRTLLPLVRNMLLVILVTLVTLVVLSELGLNIAPLLAGAGVIGLAIGFGSQTLVKDVITGLFFLFEDTVSVGDIVRVSDEHSGVVEAMSIRTLKLRDFSGAVHTIPFSAVTTITNMTKDYSYAVFEVAIGFRENVERVVDLMREAGVSLMKDAMYTMDILEPIDIQGLERFSDTALIIKARIKTRPTRQWAVMRAFNLLLKKMFDEQGVEIPWPNRAVVLETGKGRPSVPEVTGDTEA